MAQTKQQVAIITGGGTGIGLATARMLAKKGWGVAITGRREAKLAEAARQIEKASFAPVLIVAADVSDRKQAAGVVDAALLRFGRVDAVINAAGAAEHADIDQSSGEVLDRILGVNTIAPAAIIARAWTEFKKQESGCVVNISSWATHDPFPGFFAYAASKAAVNLMARSCAVEGREIGVLTFSHVICRPTEAEAQEYHDQIMSQIDWPAVDNLVNLQFAHAQSFPHDLLAQIRNLMALGHGGFPLIGYSCAMRRSGRSSCAVVRA